MSPGTLDYDRTPSARPTAWPNVVVGGITALLPILFAAAALLRREQLAQPNPWSNPYTPWSMLCVLAFAGLVPTNAVLAILFRQHLRRPVLYTAWAVLTWAGLWILTCGLRTLLFISP